MALLASLLVAFGAGSRAATPPTPRTTPTPQTATAPPTLTRLAGADRIGTAIAVSQAMFPNPGSAGAVVLTRADDFPDALAGAPLAAARKAPILLTGPTALDPATRAELQRALPGGGTVYLLGGGAALSPAVAATVTGLGYKIVRYAGADRYATAVAIAGALGNPATVLLADGTNFADSLSAGTAAAAAGGAVLFTDGRVMAPATGFYLEAHATDTLDAVGGPAVAAAHNATAFAGADRYATAVAVAERFFPKPATVGLASGVDFPDALSGGPASAAQHAPMLLTDPTNLSAATAAYLQSVDATLTTIDVYGGPGAVSDAVITAADQGG